MSNPVGFYTQSSDLYTADVSNPNAGADSTRPYLSNNQCVDGAGSHPEHVSLYSRCVDLPEDLPEDFPYVGIHGILNNLARHATHYWAVLAEALVPEEGLMDMWLSDLYQNYHVLGADDEKISQEEKMSQMMLLRWWNLAPEARTERGMKERFKLLETALKAINKEEDLQKAVTEVFGSSRNQVQPGEPPASLIDRSAQWNHPNTDKRRNVPANHQGQKLHKLSATHCSDPKSEIVEPSFRFLSRLSVHLTGFKGMGKPYWALLGAALGLEKEELGNIERSNGAYHNHSDKARAMFGLWLQRGDATFQALGEGIEALGYPPVLQAYSEFRKIGL